LFFVINNKKQNFASEAGAAKNIASEVATAKIKLFVFYF
jgi:hypothetical protein